MKKNNNLNVIFRNYTAMVGWVFMILWFAFLLVFTQLFLRKGMPGINALFAAGILLAFWTVGISVGAAMFATPCTRVDRMNGALIVREFWLWKRRSHRFDLLSDPPATRIDVAQGEHGPGYHLVLVLDNETIVPLAQGFDRETVEDENKRFLDYWKLAA